MSDLFYFLKILGYVAVIPLFITAITFIFYWAYSGHVAFLILGIFMVAFGVAVEIFWLYR